MRTHISLEHPVGADKEQIRNFSGFSHILVQCTKISFCGGGGGGCVCFLKSVRKGRFRNVWVWGGGGSQFCTKSCKRTDTQGTGNALRITHYSDILSGAPLSGVLLATCMFHILLQIDVDAGCQKLML